MGIKTLMKFHERMASTLVAGVPSAQGSDVLRQPGCFSDENQAGCLAKIQDSHEEHDGRASRHPEECPVRGGGGGEHEQLDDQLPQCGQPALQPAAGAQRQHVPRHP